MGFGMVGRVVEQVRAAGDRGGQIAEFFEYPGLVEQRAGVVWLALQDFGVMVSGKVEAAKVFVERGQVVAAFDAAGVET